MLPVILAIGTGTSGPSADSALAAVLRAMRHGAMYVNVHTTTFAGGEIRGQIQK